MSFNGTEGDPITLAQGADLTLRFRTNNPTQLRGRFFGKELLNQILNQSGCKGIRFYFGQNTSNQFELVICGADANENDMLNLIGDISTPCPPTCGTKNSLNGM